jgi:hypothetical protein
MLVRPFRRNSPTLSSVHIDTALTNFGVALLQRDQNHYIFNKVAPIIPVEKMTDKYWVIPRDEWMIDEAQPRTDSTESMGGSYTLSTDSYEARVWAFHRDLGHLVRANADAGLNLERGASEFVTYKLLLRQEIEWASNFFVPGVWTNQLSGDISGSVGANEFVYWNDYANSDPFEDIEDAKEMVEGVTDIEPNTWVISKPVYRTLKHHPIIRDRIKYTSSGSVTIDLLKQLFEIENIYVARSIRNTANRGATASYSRIHGKHAWLGYVSPNPGPQTPTAMATFAWTGVSGGLGQTIGLDSFDIRRLKTRRVEGEIAMDHKIISQELGVFMNGVVQ